MTQLPSLVAPLFLGAFLSAQTPLTFELVAEGLLDPLHASAPKGDDRVFISEHGGVIKVAKDGVVNAVPFLDLTAKVPPPPAGEAGFFGTAFHPDYANNGYFYVHYTDVNFDTVVERYQVSATNPDVADPASASLVLFQPQPSAYHNGGGIKFGPDGYLYLAFGDGGAGLGPACTAQDTSVLLGKMLRLDVDSAQPYAIPPTNPFVGVPGEAEEIYHFGLRNPWRFSIDPLTGDMYIGDVGAMTWEELDYAPGGAAGLDFGWPLNEGDSCFGFHACSPTTFPSCDDPSFTGPILTATHLSAPFACAMVGGEVYRGCAIPELSGRYFFTDYCDSRIRSFVYDPVGGLQDLRDHAPELAAFYPNSMFITSFGTDGDGELLFVYQATPDLDGKVYRMVAAQTPAGFVDCDVNGKDDACEIAGEPGLDADSNGVLDVCESLELHKTTFSVSAGGPRRMELHPGPAYAGRVYLLAGSLTGTAGIPVGSVTVPLTADVYTNFTIAHPNTPPLQNSFGMLDAQGEAMATFSTPPGAISASLIGTSVWHAFGLITPSGTLDYASNAVKLDLVP